MISHKTIKYISSLKEKKFRLIHNEFVVEGEKIVSELLESSYDVTSVYATEEWCSKYIESYKDRTYPIITITQKELERISNLKTPNNVLAVAKISKSTSYNMAFNKGFTLLLDDIRDPGNMGTILRAADWFGFDNILCSETSVDLYNPKVIQASMGSFIRVKAVYTDLKKFIEQNNKIPVIGTFISGEPVYTIKNIVNSGFVIIGNEAGGISNDLITMITHRVSVPCVSKSIKLPESMNAAVAAGIVMYELSRKI